VIFVGQFFLLVGGSGFVRRFKPQTFWFAYLSFVMQVDPCFEGK
jgi:hypothetical protein